MRCNRHHYARVSVKGQYNVYVRNQARLKHVFKKTTLEMFWICRMIIGIPDSCKTRKLLFNSTEASKTALITWYPK